MVIENKRSLLKLAFEVALPRALSDKTSRGLSQCRGTYRKAGKAHLSAVILRTTVCISEKSMLRDRRRTLITLRIECHPHDVCET